MKKNLTHIIALLDKSGSMQPVQADTIGGFNTFLEEQKKVPGEATLTLAQFSDKYELTYSDVPLAHVAPLTKDTYVPGGWTALNDSLAQLITDVGAKLAAKPEEERPSKVVVLIMTDGQENKSKEFVGAHGLKKVGEMVKHQQEKYSWMFSFLGANLDAFSVSAGLGIAKEYAINYTGNSVGTSNAFKSMSRGVVGARSGVQMTGGFFENEKDKGVVYSASLDTSDINEAINKYYTPPPALNDLKTPDDKKGPDSDTTKS